MTIPHQLFPDLCDASVRNRFYGGRDPEALAAEFPVLPVDAPGLPPPGPSFLTFARALGDPPPPAAVRGRPKPRPTGAYLTALVRNVLYQCGTVMQVDNAGTPLDVVPLPGALCTAHKGFTYGPGPCRLMVIGKCIGATEAQSFKPYCGRGSEPLWDAWDEVGLPRPGPALPAFLTNLVPFAPPHTVKTLPREWVQDGLHLFYQQFAACRPAQILVLGADALKALYGNRAKIEDYRGRATKLAVDCRPTVDYPEDVHEAVVTVADHPAAVSRDPDKYPQFRSAMQFAAVRLGAVGKAAQIPLDHAPIYTLDDLRREVSVSVAASAGGGYVAFDAEWEGRDFTHPDSYVYTVQWSHAPGHARCAFLRRCGGVENPDMPRAEVAAEFNRLLAAAPARGARLVGHFAKADLPWLKEKVGVDLYPYYVGAADDPNPDGRTALYGWQKCYFEGAFDTYVGGHAVSENQPLKLEVIASAKLGIDRYDSEVIAWKERYCKAKKISAAKLLGYGNIDEHIIYPYGCFDADAAGRLYLYLNGDPRKDTRGALDCDEYKNSSREIFAIRMRAWAAAAEIEYEGLAVDADRHRELRDILVAKRDELIERLRTEANWHGDPTANPPVEAFDPARRSHRIDFLFGEEYQDNGKPKRPPGALSLYLTPHKATASGDGRLWADACARAARADLPRPAPAADKETLIVLSRRHAMVALLKDIDFVATALKGLLRPPIEGPAADEDADENDPDAQVEEVFERGFMYHRCHDGRVRTMLALVETGRYSSKKPNLQNLSDAVNDQFNRILGWAKYAQKGTPERDKKFVSRSVVTCRRGWRVVTADLMGAEIAIAAWFSGDPLLIEVARRSTLKEDDPDYLDQHADLARRSFGLTCSLAEVKENYKHLRTAAKRARFGHYYGASPETILRKAQEDSDTVTLEQIVAIVRGHDEAHPVLANFFAAARAQVSKPGHMCNGFGGRRRFRPSRERDLLAGQEREAQNWTCQGFVADAISYALGELWAELRLRRMRSRIILTVHDSIMVECPPEEVAVVHDELLPLCMTERTAIVPTDLNGNPIPGRGPYHFGIDREVCARWGEPIEEEVWRAEVAAATAAV